MIKFRKMIFAAISAITILSMNSQISVYAQDKVTLADNSEQIIVIREDVPSSIARKDETYDESISKKYDSRNSLMSNNKAETKENVRWDISGERLYDNRRHLMAPYGYSAHMKDNTVLKTYHYTRVYFGRSKAGDSDRVWGEGKVYATGTWTDWEVASNNTLYVKYGTESK